MVNQEYTYEDGLKVLKYLGIANLTEQEIKIFREKWSNFYNGDNPDFIGSIWKLYSEALPFICGDGDRKSFLVAQLRDSDFGKRLDESGLGEELKQGINLEDILKKGPHKFITIVNLE